MLSPRQQQQVPVPALLKIGQQINHGLRARLREIKPDQGDLPLRSACAKIKLKSSGGRKFFTGDLSRLGKAHVEIVRG